MLVNLPGCTEPHGSVTPIRVRAAPASHGRPEFLLAESQRVFGTVADADYLRDRDRDSLSRSLAWTWVSSLSVEVQNYWSGSGRVGS